VRTLPLKLQLVAACSLWCSLISMDALSQSADWGLLAPNRNPIKGVYFFPGPAPLKGQNDARWTKQPENSAYLNGELAERQAIIVNEIASVGANVIVMSDWDEEYDHAGPMKPEWPKSYEDLFSAVARMPDQPLKIMPAIEGVDYDKKDMLCPRFPAYDYPGFDGIPAPWLRARISRLVTRFAKNPSHPEWAGLWAKMYDQEGVERYVINLLHMASNYDPDPERFAVGLDRLAGAIWNDYKVAIGFTIDPFNSQCGPAPYFPKPEDSQLKRARSFLGIQAFNPEITVGAKDPQNLPGAPFNACAGLLPILTCTNNNAIDENLVALQSWKREWIRAWIEQANVPVILDVSPGYDGHLIFPSSFLSYPPLPPEQYSHVGLYGDSTQDPIHDSWRNHQSQMKRRYSGGQGALSGIVYNAWNGFGEALTAVPSRYVAFKGAEPSQVYYTQLNWLRDQFSSDPRYCDHTHYLYGSFSAHVYGAICDLWQQLGAEDGFGAPLASEEPSLSGRGRKTEFQNGGTIYYNSCSGAHEVHGVNNIRYKQLHEDAGRLGFPVSDERSVAGGGRQNLFQHGAITWRPQWPQAIETYCATPFCNGATPKQCGTHN
jgi:hypothetical protein